MRKLPNIIQPNKLPIFRKHAKDLLRKEYEYQVTVNQELKTILAQRKKELDGLTQVYMRAVTTGGTNIDTQILNLL